MISSIERGLLPGRRKNARRPSSSSRALKSRFICPGISAADVSGCVRAMSDNPFGDAVAELPADGPSADGTIPGSRRISIGVFGTDLEGRRADMSIVIRGGPPTSSSRRGASYDDGRGPNSSDEEGSAFDEGEAGVFEEGEEVDVESSFAAGDAAVSPTAGRPDATVARSSSFSSERRALWYSETAAAALALEVLHRVPGTRRKLRRLR